MRVISSTRFVQAMAVVVEDEGNISRHHHFAINFQLDTFDTRERHKRCLTIPPFSITQPMPKRKQWILRIVGQVFLLGSYCFH